MFQKLMICEQKKGRTLPSSRCPFIAIGLGWLPLGGPLVHRKSDANDCEAQRNLRQLFLSQDSHRWTIQQGKNPRGGRSGAYP